MWRIKASWSIFKWFLQGLPSETYEVDGHKFQIPRREILRTAWNGHRAMQEIKSGIYTTLEDIKKRQP